ncbi:MAG TPA: family 16 glycoside hydrolase [Abditibacteriaceae bacterium]
MKIGAALAVLALLYGAASSRAQEKNLFNGKDLTGWQGNPELWSVRDGVITGQTTPEKPAGGNTFLIWQEGDKPGEISDFELTLKYRILDKNGEGKGYGNSGIQYRSKVADPAKWVVGGYQADFEIGKTYSGILYEERGRGILAQRGQKVVIREGEAPNKPKIEVTGEVGKSDEIQAAIKQGDWNEYKVIAKGNHLQHFINGKLTVDVTDETAVGAKSGILALQLHAGDPMTVQFKDIVLRPIESKVAITGQGRRFFAADYDKRVMAIVSADGKIEWSQPMQGGTHDAWMLPSGNILWTPSGDKVFELDPKTNQTVWTYDAGKMNGNEGKKVEVHAVQPQADGSVVVFEAGPARVIEIDRNGKLLKQVPLQIAAKEAHHQMRNARKLKNGNYLVSQDGDGKIVEYDGAGKIVWSYDTPGLQPYSALRLDNGNTLIGTGNGHSVVEVDKDGKEVWKVGENDLPNIKLAWVTQIERLPNGNTLIVNCHAGPTQPQIIEVTPDKKVAWTYHNFENFGNSLPVAFVLDSPGSSR